MPKHFTPCIVIPFYNHGSTLAETVSLLLPYAYPLIIVDDGSDAGDASVANNLEHSHNLVTVLRLEQNQGKGAAIMHGMRYALTHGYTHALQIDADLQHDTEDVGTLMESARTHPDQLILAYPVFGPEAPFERVWGRKLTTLMIQLQTWSFQAKDGLFGFRVYPLQETVAVLNEVTVSPRMAFDPEILIRLIRHGITVVNVPSAVQYPTNGISHFRYVTDNAGMVAMHIRLLADAFISPVRSMFGSMKPSSWYTMKELGTPWLLRMLFSLGKLFGKQAVRLCLSPVLFCLLLFKRSLRRSSQHYLTRSLRQENPPTFKQSFSHVRSFADRVVDSVFAWDEARISGPHPIPEMSTLRARLLNGSGGILLSAHFGALEFARARFSLVPQLRIKPVMYHANSKTYRGFLEHVNHQAHDNVILIESISPATIIQLREHVASGGYLALLADRLPPGTSERTLEVSLFGTPVSLPYGAFLLAELLKVDVLTLFCPWQNDNQLQFEWEDITPSWERIPDRTTRIQEMADAYAKNLETICYQHPYQWYNFYDYFRDES